MPLAAYLPQVLQPWPPPLAGDFTIVPDASTPPSRGQTVTFKATITGGRTPYEYNWDFGDGIQGGGNPVTHAYSKMAHYKVTLVVTDQTL
jgi:PKD repeat protein